MPMVVTRKDTGYFVRALVETAPGKKLLGVGSFISWRDYMKLWAKIQGVPEGRYREITVADMDKMAPGGGGREIAEAHAYMEEFGYDGGDPTVIRPEDVSTRPDLIINVGM